MSEQGEQRPVTSAEVIAWHRARFGEPDDALVGLKGAEEMGEVAGAVVKRAEGAVRPDKGMHCRDDDWTRHLLDEVGDVGIVLHTLCAREGTTLDEVVTRRFRDDVSQRVGQERPASRHDEQCPMCTSPQPHLHPALGIATHALIGAPVALVWLLFLPTVVFAAFANPWWLQWRYRRHHSIDQGLHEQVAEQDR